MENTLRTDSLVIHRKSVKKKTKRDLWVEFHNSELSRQEVNHIVFEFRLEINLSGVSSSQICMRGFERLGNVVIH